MDLHTVQIKHRAVGDHCAQFQLGHRRIGGENKWRAEKVGGRFGSKGRSRGNRPESRAGEMHTKAGGIWRRPPVIRVEVEGVGAGAKACCEQVLGAEPGKSGELDPLGLAVQADVVQIIVHRDAQSNLHGLRDKTVQIKPCPIEIVAVRNLRCPWMGRADPTG